MATPHINAKPGDYAKTVLMPGDPLRAKYIAENFLSDVVLVNSVRNALGYTGYYKGKKVSVQASGMGQPSIGIYCHELFSHYDVETIIRIGTCGAYHEHINLHDIIIGSGASTDSNWSRQFDLKGGTFSAISDFEVTKRAYESMKKHQLPVHVGNIFSSDVFYDFDPSSYKKWAKLGCLGVEMEAYALYTTAALLNKKALCILTVTDHFLKPEKLSAHDRETGLRKMIEATLDIIE